MGQLKTRTSGVARRLISAASIAILLTTNVQAVVLSDLEGGVSVNHGDGFQPASIGFPLAPGDMVRTSDGFAVIQYENGCSTRLGPQEVRIVFIEPPVCNGGGLKDGVVTTAPGAAEPGLDPLLAGGLVAGAATGIALIASSRSHRASPASD